ncbi:MAG: hypothetical protein IT577_04310 [Verrucomicrobiae bacterium]|nr:hypothetical protein [Verrucomicrobiae bacterium]
MMRTFLLLSSGCLPFAAAESRGATAEPDGTFGADAAFLQKHAGALVLRSGDAAVAVVPGYQGRVMTATYAGDAGPSTGWINYDLIRSGRKEQHIHVFGGEERIWIGPEGGQFSIYFAPKSEFTFDHWFVPAPIDTDAFKVEQSDAVSAAFSREFKLRNWSGFEFDVRAERTVRLLDRAAAAKAIGAEIPAGLKVVAYETRNALVNRGKAPWKKDTGLLSIWMLGMLKHSPTTTVFIPVKSGDGPAVNTDYFGAIPEARLQTINGVVYFRGDGNFRSKIGIPPTRSKHVAGSFDPAAGRITLIACAPPAPGHAGYVNSAWKLQDNPFGGDALNAYNDGPLDGGGQLGPFYELESSSPAYELAPGARMEHTQTTVHIAGEATGLDAITRAIAGADTAAIAAALPPATPLPKD